MRTLLLVLAVIAASPAVADCAKFATPCEPTDGIWDDSHLACLQGKLAKARSEMNKAYEQRFKITVASARQRLATVQDLWARSTNANCEYFGNVPESAATKICLINAMIERKQTLEALD
jgi:uncharacterized protein YecT (DUF1311 family)